MIRRKVSKISCQPRRGKDGAKDNVIGTETWKFIGPIQVFDIESANRPRKCDPRDSDKIVARFIKHLSPRCLRDKQARPIRDERRISRVTGVQEIYDGIETKQRVWRNSRVIDTIFAKIYFSRCNIRMRIEIRRCFVLWILPSYLYNYNDRWISCSISVLIISFISRNESPDIFRVRVHTLVQEFY